MRDKPNLWKGADRIQWGCVLMHMLGESTLELLPVVLSGLHSVERSRQVALYQAAVQTARTLLGDLLTKHAVQSAVAEFLSVNREGRSFDINEDTLNFHAHSEYDPAITQAEAILREGLVVRTRMLDLADTTRDLVAELDAERRMRLRLRGLTFPRPEQHDLRRQPMGPITVHWSELEALPAELDAADAGAGRSSENWTGRLAKTRLQVTTGTGLHPADVLQLAGLEHLIGLPGSGKTTIIMLLCILLERQRLRVGVFFTAIEVAREYLEKLRRYGLRTALLVGRSPDTHLRHGNDLAELIATQGRGGFAQTREGIDLLAQSRPLPAFADSWPSENEWRLGEAPCERIYEAGSKTPKLCPAWSLCGRVKNQRELVHASVWLGHILSADTMVPRLTCTEHLRYFELVARTFDLVIVDECDESQKVLDDRGTLTLKLTGDDQSIHISLQQTAGLLAANRARISDGMLRYIQRANEFERHTLRFVDEIRRLQKTRPDLAYRYSEKLLAASFLLREALEVAGRAERIAPQIRLLIAVGFTIASYQRLAKDARHLAWRGEVPEASDLVFSKVSGEMREVVPRSTLGTFSSVRYRQAAATDGLEIRLPRDG